MRLKKCVVYVYVHAYAHEYTYALALVYAYFHAHAHEYTYAVKWERTLRVLPSTSTLTSILTSTSTSAPASTSTSTRTSTYRFVFVLCSGLCALLYARRALPQSVAKKQTHPSFAVRHPTQPENLASAQSLAVKAPHTTS